jgi:hypothetical protein
MTGCKGIEKKMAVANYEVLVQHLLGAVLLKLI